MAASETNIFSIINPEGGHPSVKGALLIAELVWPWLKPQLESAFPEVARR